MVLRGFIGFEALEDRAKINPYLPMRWRKARLKICFRGKWISRSGLFEGFVAGTYGHCLPDDTDLERQEGYFRGKIFTAERIDIGILKGKYQHSEFVDDGFFQGRWRIACPDPEDQSDDTEENF